MFDLATSLPNPNLLIGGTNKVTNSNYMITGYNLKENLVLGDTYTFTICGELGEDRKAFKVYDQMSWNEQATLDKVGNYLYSKSFSFNPYNKLQLSYLSVYLDSAHGKTESTVYWAKLEKGDQRTPQVALFDYLYWQNK